jgi:hypothetical protein
VPPLSRENRRDELAEQIPDGKMDLFATVKTYEALPDAIAQRYGGCTDSLLLQISSNDDEARLAACVAEIQEILSPTDGSGAGAEDTTGG